MTGQGDPLAHRQQYVSYPSTPRRKKLEPDPGVRRAIVEAAAKSVREQGVRGLSIAAVLERAQLSTRAFYRHFDSKDQLVAAVFLEMTRSEVARLRDRMADATDPVQAVAAWIDGRLDLAFDEDIKAELRQVSLEAQSKVFSTPDAVTPAYGAILEPLVEQLQRGLDQGIFVDIVPATAAKSIHGVVWAGTQRQWATNQWNRDEIRDRAVRFCLRGLGVAPDDIEKVAAGGAAAR